MPLGAAGSGSYRVDPDAGWINITHSGYDGGSDRAVLYNESLGALVYEDGDVTIAYQGGGVWRSQGANSTMVSPPEFHYQSATLTLPVIRVSGDSSTGGATVRAKVSTLASADRIYPNDLDTYPDGTTPYANPIREGNVTVTVHSTYWEAWADYFRTRTSGEVTVQPEEETVSVLLISQGISGTFSMPADGNSIEIRGLGDNHPVTDFTVTLIDDDGDAASFSNLQWSLYADKGARNFEIHLRDNSGGSCGGDVRATVYYSENNGGNYESWTDGSAFQYECESPGNDFNGDGDVNDIRLIANFTDTTPLTYERVQGGDGTTHVFSVSGSDTFDDPTTWDQHAAAVPDLEPTTFDEGTGTTSFNNVTNHYLSLMGPDVELTVQDKNSNTVNEEASFGQFEQGGGGGKFITFLHITENRVTVEIE